MSVEQCDVIDFLYFNPGTQTIVLVITDHLSWDEETEGVHLELLQKKLIHI